MRSPPTRSAPRTRRRIPRLPALRPGSAWAAASSLSRLTRARACPSRLRCQPPWLAGDYLGGVAVEAQGQSRTERVSRGVAIGETDRYAIGVEVKLPGPRHPLLTLSGASVGREPSGLVFSVNAGNTGNVILKNVHGWVRVTKGNRLVASARIAPGYVRLGHDHQLSGAGAARAAGSGRRLPSPRGLCTTRAELPGSTRASVFSHAAAVKQQNYGGRKLPKSFPVWRWILFAILLLVLIASARKVQQRRRRPLDRSGGDAASRRPARARRRPTGEHRPAQRNPPAQHRDCERHPQAAAPRRPRLRPRARRPARDLSAPPSARWQTPLHARSSDSSPSTPRLQASRSRSRSPRPTRRRPRRNW